MLSIAASWQDSHSSLIWGYVNNPLFQSNMAYLNSICFLCCIILTFGKQSIAFQKRHLCFSYSPKQKAGGALAPLCSHSPASLYGWKKTVSITFIAFTKVGPLYIGHFLAVTGTGQCVFAERSIGGSEKSLETIRVLFEIIFEIYMQI